MKAIELKKERRTSKFVDELIDHTTTRKQFAKIEDEVAFVMSDHHVEVMEERELKGVFDFAEHVIKNPVRACAEFNLDQKQRFQRSFFPRPWSFDRERGFGTPTTSLIVRYLRQIQTDQPSMAPHIVLSWNLFGGWLRDLARLHIGP